MAPAGLRVEALHMSTTPSWRLHWAPHAQALLLAQAETSVSWRFWVLRFLGFAWGARASSKLQARFAGVRCFFCRWSFRRRRLSRRMVAAEVSCAINHSGRVARGRLCQHRHLLQNVSQLCQAILQAHWGREGYLATFPPNIHRGFCLCPCKQTF